METSVAEPFVFPSSLTSERMSQGALMHQAAVLPIRVRPIATPEELIAAQRLRGQTVLDHRWAGELPDGLDCDEYDEDATHLGGWDGETLVMTGRMVFPSTWRLLPTETAFDLRLPGQERSIDIGRVVVAPALSEASSSLLLALIGGFWQQAGGRTHWVGTNTAGVIRLYRRLGAVEKRLGPARQYRGEWRYPVLWDMDQFAIPYWELAQRRAKAA